MHGEKIVDNDAVEPLDKFSQSNETQKEKHRRNEYQMFLITMVSNLREHHESKYQIRGEKKWYHQNVERWDVIIGHGCDQIQKKPLLQV